MTDWPTITVSGYEDGGQPVVPVTTLRFNGVSIPGGTYYLIPKDKVRAIPDIDRIEWRYHHCAAHDEPWGHSNATDCIIQVYETVAAIVEDTDVD